MRHGKLCASIISNICPLWTKYARHGYCGTERSEQNASDEITEAQEFKASKEDEAKKG
jgi:hypothetical protein